MASVRSEFDHQLDELRQQLLEMASDVDDMIATAIRALTGRDVALAERVISDDDAVDALDLAIETRCMRLIARQQPVARDLRLVGTALKVITDLERMGDHAVDIAKAARKLAAEPITAALIDAPRMAEAVRRMLADAMAAFVSHELDLVDSVLRADDDIDTMFHRARDVLHATMRRDPALVVQASYLLFVAHYLERIADHAVNIAERVHYIETGDLAQQATSHRASS